MLALLQAIKAKFAADSTLTSNFPGGLWRDRAPAGAQMPYVVTDIESGSTDTYYGEATYNDTAVRFTATGIGHDAIGAITESLDGKFKSSILSLTSGQQFNVYRMHEPRPVMSPVIDPSGQEIWSWFVTYIFSVSN